MLGAFRVHPVLKEAYGRSGASRLQLLEADGLAAQAPLAAHAALGGWAWIAPLVASAHFEAPSKVLLSSQALPFADTLLLQLLTTVILLPFLF